MVRRWSGLGYNRRALSLHRAATAIVADHGGVVPRQDAALRALAGVGAYTARAVRSFAFGDDVAAIDTNAVRVLARCVSGRSLSVTEASRMGDRLVPPGGSWEFNQAMFDLGATVCTGSRPACGSCPLRRQCRWHRDGWADPDPWRAGPSARPRRRSPGRTARAAAACSRRCAGGSSPPGELAGACGWPDDPARAERIAAAMVAEGFAQWSGGEDPVLRLRETGRREAATP